MSVKTSANRFPLDALLVLEPTGSAAVTASGASANFIALDVLSAYWNTGDVSTLLDFAVVIETTAIGGTSPTFSFAVQVAPDTGAFGSPVSIVSTAVTAVGRTVIVVERDDIQNALGASASAGSLRLYATLGGTSPTITYTAYVSPLTGD